MSNELLAQALEKILARAKQPDCPHLDGPTDFAISESRGRAIGHIALLSSEALAANEAPAAVPVEPVVPAGWRLDVAFSDGRAWLNITTPAGSSACLSATHKTGNGDDTIAAQILAYLRDDLAHPAPQPQRCPHCDDTGDVHSADGEWRGACTCPAGASPQPTPPQQAAPEQANQVVPEGCAIVPLEPTDDMLNAGKKVIHDSYSRSPREKSGRMYRAMLAATPPQPTAPAPQPEPLHLGACITDGKLHATVMRREANGYITVVAAAEIDEVSLRAGDCHALMTAPAPQAQAVSQWLPIESAPEGVLVVVSWLDPEDSEHPERHELDYLDEGSWAKHRDHYEHVCAIGGYGVSETPPYTGWLPLPPVTAVASAAQKEPT